METTRIQSKIKLLFDQISQPNYVMNTYYADSFINKISNTSDPDAVSLISMPLLPNLLIEALKDTGNYHNSVNVFLVRLLAIVSRKEPHFCKILEKRRDKLLDFHNGITEKKINPSLKVAYLEVALSLAAHRSGISWLLQTELWKKILSLYDKSTTVFVLRLMYKFSADFVWKLNDLDDEVNLNAVIKFILHPILGLNFSNVVTLTIDEERNYCDYFEPVLQMILSIISRKERIYCENKVSMLLIKEYCIVTHLYVLVDRIRREDTMLLAHKNLLYFVLIKLFHTKPLGPDVVYTQEDFMDFLVVYFNAMQTFIQKRNAIMVLDYCGNCNLIWRQVCDKVTLASGPSDGKTVEMQNQMMLIYLIPILVYMNNNSKGCANNEYLNQHMSDFINMACQHTARAAYALRDLILELDTPSITLQSVKRLACFKDHLNDAQANFVFKLLFFALTEYDPTNMYSETAAEAQMLDFDETEQEVLVMTYIVDILCALVKNYNINWHESIEVICLNSVLHNILTKRQNLTCKFVVASLRLLTVTVAKFLPPNLSLLMESQPGSAMHEIGELIYTKMHDVHWEVRDSALELLIVCTDISFIKFPPLQKQIIERNLITVAITMAVNDHEPYVQVSALKCLASACKIAPIWEQMKTEHPTVLEQLISILRHNQEGIVRKEACFVLCEIYQHVKLSSGFKQVLYDHMTSAAMCEFHWEVQLNALKFWKIVIQFFLTDQGMLDGTFPSVTFSRETRKIVTLNETEVRKILLRLLDELASIGCLTVLLRLLQDDTEVEVMDAAFAIANELFSTLVKYEVPDSIKPVEGEPKSMADLISLISDESESSMNVEDAEAESSTRSDHVIEGILKSDDLNLLASIYQKGMNLQNKSEKTLSPKFKLLKDASPYLFVSFLKGTDCKKTIMHKREWKNGIRSISSLLDDVLGLYEETGEVNSLDCY